MKRVWAAVIGLCLITSGCFQTGAKNTDQAEGKETAEATTSPSTEATTGRETAKPNGGEGQTSAFMPVARSAYKLPDFTAKVTPYQVEKKLANVVNKAQFSGFDGNQMKDLEENGFVVVPATDTRVFHVYDQNEYNGIPSFITTDSILHLYHQFYDKSLMHVEAEYLSKDLAKLTSGMVEQSVALYGKLQEESLRKLQEKNIVYFLVAESLMDPGYAAPAQLDPAWTALAAQELKLIQEAGAMTHSPLLGRDLDYSEFKVRGHYTKSEELGRFFRTMIWFGTAALSFYDENETLQTNNTLQALLMTYASFQPSTGGGSGAELWSRIYGPTGEYVGVSDDIHIANMNDVLLKVYGAGSDPNHWLDAKYNDKLRDAIKELPEPQIQAKLAEKPGFGSKQFRFMGQRYILDGDIMQTLIEPVKRPIPTGLDVMGVMGSQMAESLIFDHLQPQREWPAYTDKYKQLKNEVAAYPDKSWQRNLYSGWLWSLQALLDDTATSEGMPFFMKNNNWKYKSLNTALASYTELKHDTVLYGKRPMAEMGGPVDHEQQNYVEPNVALYNRVSYLLDNTLAVLADRKMLNEQMETIGQEFSDLLDLLINCSVKELNNEPLTKEENERLFWYGGTLENLSLRLLITSSEDADAVSLSEMVVSDVATSSAGNLTLGTGYFDHIYVVVPIGGKLVLSRGSVYSYYEFTSNTRLTDEEWWSLQGLKQVTDEHSTYMEMGKPSADLPDQPHWTFYFKHGKNGVNFKEVNVDWNKLNE